VIIDSPTSSSPGTSGSAGSGSSTDAPGLSQRMQLGYFPGVSLPTSQAQALQPQHGLTALDQVFVELGGSATPGL
jgi:hypothetical protein